MHDVWAHPQLAARGRWREVGSPAGVLPAMLPPGSWGEGQDSGPRMDPVPALGEHTDAILAELGLDAVGIRALRAAEAI
jgi:crotonobetainyl-CoA:carnitine CoA-transferase CaiB-like acyl-CoA transferase